jgi:hypothetical protein
VGTCASGSPPCLGSTSVSSSGVRVVTDAPIVDPSTEKVFAFYGSNGSFSAVIQSDVTLSASVTATLGSGTAHHIHAGAFDNTYHRGRFLHEIQEWPDGQLETIHDYIQWLFPLPERSGFNVDAPVLDGKSIQEFQTRADLQENLRVSFLRMMRSYGLEVHVGEHFMVTRAPNFPAKATVWLSPSNHNHLRITRILRCLSLLGLEPEAKAFFDCLSEIYEDEQK